MSSPETFPHPTLTFIGGGTTGETAAGFLDAVEAGLVPGIDSVHVNAIVGSQDSGSRTGDLREWYRLHAVGDYRRTISALGDSYAAPLFEKRFGEDATPEDVAQTGEELLTALSYSGTTVLPERRQEIIEKSIALSQDIMKREGKKLAGLTIGHLVVASLMQEHRLSASAGGKGQNVQTALDETSALMAARGRVIADSLVPHDLEMQDGQTRIFGEANIDNHTIMHPDDVRLKVVPVEPFTSVPASPTALEAITASEAVIIGPGSAYTSNIPPLLADGMPKALQEAEADGQQLIIVANLAKEATTAPTMTVPRYVREIEKYAGRKSDRIVYNHNTASLPEGQAFSIDRDELEQLSDYQVVPADLVGETNVAQDPNDQLTNRSKVRTKWDTAAVAALAADPHEVLRLAA
jgi:uncharacterized cofD-like protein